jgi:SagB-type dehydrogenase family enzyme
MTPTDLGNPKVRLKQKPIQEFAYRTGKPLFLPPPSHLPRSPFFSTILKRRSRREFLEVSIVDLSNVLWFTCKTLEINREPTIVWQHRCTPSAGGIHPIDILVLTPAKSKEAVFIYEPISHSLRPLSGIARSPLNRMIEQTNEVVPIASGTLIWFVAQFQKTLSRYENGESLVWRDSGALLASFCMVAEALSLNCCAIGATGNPHISEIFGKTDKLRGVGGCLLGDRLKRS